MSYKKAIHLDTHKQQQHSLTRFQFYTLLGSQAASSQWTDSNQWLEFHFKMSERCAGPTPEWVSDLKSLRTSGLGTVPPFGTIDIRARSFSGGGHPAYYSVLSSIPGPHSLDVWKTPVKDHNPEQGTLQQDLFTKLNLDAQPLQ